MTFPQLTTLFFAPTGQYVEAKIVQLSAEMAERQIHGDWWADPGLKAVFQRMPIDRYWNWNDMTIDFEGKQLTAIKVAIVTGDQAVQGAMMVSTEAVPSTLDPGAHALFVELLFTAPRNRPPLRHDGKPFFLGVGSELLSWAARLSQETGCGGNLMLDASPDYVKWYENRGLQKLGSKPIVFQGVKYTPMELSASAAEKLLND